MNKIKSFLDELTKISKELTSSGRKRISEDNFALPYRRYPIHDIEHGRNALARVSQHGTKNEKNKVRKAVYRKYPSLVKKALEIPIKKGDTVLKGRFKNSPMEVKEIGKDKHNQPTINGKQLLAVRIKKLMDKD